MTESQRYVSTELSHFVGRSLRDDEQRFRLLVTILRTGSLTPTPGRKAGSSSFDTGGRFRDESLYSNECMCFCDIPVPDLHLHIRKYGRFGISFRRTFLAARGANPVFYVGVNTPLRCVLGNDTRSNLFEKTLKDLARIENHVEDLWSKGIFDADLRSDLISVNWFLRSHVFGFAKPFDENMRLLDPDNVYMEREWRVNGQVQFNLSDVYRILIPEDYAARFRAEIPDYVGQVQFV